VADQRPGTEGRDHRLVGLFHQPLSGLGLRHLGRARQVPLGTGRGGLPLRVNPSNVRRTRWLCGPSANDARRATGPVLAVIHHQHAPLSSPARRIHIPDQVDEEISRGSLSDADVHSGLHQRSRWRLRSGLPHNADYEVEPRASVSRAEIGRVQYRAWPAFPGVGTRGVVARVRDRCSIDSRGVSGFSQSRTRPSPRSARTGALSPSRSPRTPIECGQTPCRRVRALEPHGVVGGGIGSESRKPRGPKGDQSRSTGRKETP
jgi:hypothetical protein